MIAMDRWLEGLSILLALRRRGKGVASTAKAAGRERKWLSRRIYGQVTPTNADLDQLAAIIGVDPDYFRRHFRRSPAQTVS